MQSLEIDADKIESKPTATSHVASLRTSLVGVFVFVVVGVCGHTLFARRAYTPKPIHDANELAAISSDDFATVAESLSTQLGESLEIKRTKKWYRTTTPLLLGKGMYGRIYGLAGGKDAIKITLGKLGAEELLTQNLPHTPTLLRVKKVAESDYHGKHYTAQVMDRIYGDELTVYGKRKKALNSAKIIAIAADVALALHAMHTRIKGYVVLHCDLAPKNIMVNVSLTDDNVRTVVLDYGLTLVHKLHGNQTAYDNVFPEFSEWKRCRGTNWDNYNKGVKPFNAMVEWRELGHVLYQLGETIYDKNGEIPVMMKLFAGRGWKCNYRCAAEKNINKMTRVNEQLKDFIRFLILKHETIQDEVGEILRHEVFDGMSPHPADRAADMLTPSSEFSEFYNGDFQSHEVESHTLAFLH